ncbi:hypothetical protein FDI81_gp02 [Streptomyces phage Hydra]|uniref:Uncharacterized protein n=1 Tax=Streptomyces phage Hydra TaxID=1690428 RepID=A0A0K1Y9E9_9CAUD|nr:hypothetical protein FDI81_gp02 [Streptomyces phage Hydra]AKY03533.1 hypothetical protein SEA_HYDRA_2 [Streptomyces phage Hydra]
MSLDGDPKGRRRGAARTKRLWPRGSAAPVEDDVRLCAARKGGP